jgi:hypothetical protein
MNDPDPETKAVLVDGKGTILGRIRKPLGILLPWIEET